MLTGFYIGLFLGLCIFLIFLKTQYYDQGRRPPHPIQGLAIVLLIYGGLGCLIGGMLSLLF